MTDTAPGLAAYAVTMELLSKLEEKGLLSRDEGAGIIDAALAGLERTAAQYPDAPLRKARQMLDRQLTVWQRDRPHPS